MRRREITNHGSPVAATADQGEDWGIERAGCRQCAPTETVTLRAGGRQCCRQDVMLWGRDLSSMSPAHLTLIDKMINSPQTFQHILPAKKCLISLTPRQSHVALALHLKSSLRPSSIDPMCKKLYSVIIYLQAVFSFVRPRVIQIIVHSCWSVAGGMWIGAFYTHLF